MSSSQMEKKYTDLMEIALFLMFFFPELESVHYL